MIENVEGLNSLASKLAENGRFLQSLRCKKHAETIGEMIRIKEIKRIAAEREDYDTAIQYRNLLSQLEKQLSSANEIEEWLLQYKETTLKDLEDKVKKTMGEATVLEFKEKFVLSEIRTSSDIEAAMGIMASANHYIKVKSILKDQTSIFFSQTSLILQKINGELSKAITILYKLRSHLLELSSDVDLQNYIKAISEVYFIALKLSKIICFCNSTKSFEKILCEISQNWDELKELIKTNSFDTKTDPNEPFCAICLFASKNLVMLCNTHFHPACINFWINRVSTDPPKLNITLT